MKHLGGILVVVLLCVSFVGCAKKELPYQQMSYEIPGFGERIYLFDANGSSLSISSQCVMELSGGFVNFRSVGPDADDSGIIMCSDLSCKHKLSNKEEGIPVTCEAEAPYRVGYAFMLNDAIYVVGAVPDSVTGIGIATRKLDGGGWKVLAQYEDYCLGGGAEVIGYQFVEDGRLYLSVGLSTTYEMAFGGLGSTRYGLLEIDCTTGESREIIPLQNGLYQNVYHVDKVGDQLIYAYISAPISIIRDMTDASFEELADAMYEASATHVLTVDLDTLETTELGVYAPRPLEAGVEKKSYFVGMNSGTIVFVEDNVAYSRGIDESTATKLFELEGDAYLMARRFTDKLILNKIIGEASGKVDIEFYSVTPNSCTKDEVLEQCMTPSLCLNNGYSFCVVSESNGEIHWALVQEDDAMDGEAQAVASYQ